MNRIYKLKLEDNTIVIIICDSVDDVVKEFPNAFIEIEFIGFTKANKQIHYVDKTK